MKTLLFWAAVGLTVVKVTNDIWNGTLRRELLALAVGLAVGMVVGTALLMV